MTDADLDPIFDPPPPPPHPLHHPYAARAWYCGNGIVDKGIVANVLWTIALTKVLSEITETNISVVRITVKSIV